MTFRNTFKTSELNVHDENLWERVTIDQLILIITDTSNGCTMMIT